MNQAIALLERKTSFNVKIEWNLKEAHVTALLLLFSGLLNDVDVNAEIRIKICSLLS